MDFFVNYFTNAFKLCEIDHVLTDFPHFDPQILTSSADKSSLFKVAFPCVAGIPPGMSPMRVIAFDDLEGHSLSTI